MKIEKGYTLSQFVDIVTENSGDDGDYYQNKDVVKESKIRNEFACSIVADWIEKYNNFLKQPLKKEMFVFVEPFKLDSAHKEDSNAWAPDEIESWKEAEKKVIFKGNFDNDQLVSGSYILRLYTNNTISVLKGDLRHIGNVKTIGELFEATNGELEVQNIEI